MIRHRLLLALVLFVSLMKAQMIRFERVFGAWSHEEGNGVVQTYDDGYVTVGSTGSYGNGTNELYLIKIDSMGVFKWHKYFGDVNIEVGTSIIETPDSGLVCTGYTNSSGNGGYDVWLIKTDKDGNLLWTKTIGGTDWDFGNFISLNADGGFIITGSTYSFGNGDKDIYVIRTDASGNTMWTRSYGGLMEDEGEEIVEDPSGNFILTGSTKSFGLGGKDVITMKLNSSGDTTAGAGWHRIFGGSMDDLGMSVVNGAPGEYMVGGSTLSMGPADCNFLFLRYDGNGALLSFLANGTGTFEEINSIARHPDGNFVITGRKNFVLDGQFGIHLEKTDPVGWSIWGRDFGNLQDEISNQVIVCNDSGTLIVGNTRSYGNGMNDIYIIKCDTLGWSSGSVVVGTDNIKDVASGVLVFPSVFKESFNIFSNDVFRVATAEIRLFDISGKELDFIATRFDGGLRIEPVSHHTGLVVLQILTPERTIVVKLISSH